MNTPFFQQMKMAGSTTHIMATLLLVFSLILSVSGQWYIQSQNAPNMKICLDPSQEFYPAIVDERGKRFIPHRPGLTGGDNTVSFESVDYPGRYLRHSSYNLFAEPITNPRSPDVFNADATFIVHINRYFRGYYSFESENYRNYYIRHSGGNGLSINNGSSDESFGGDVSFRMTQQMIQLQPRTQDGCTLAHCKLAIGLSNDAYIGNAGEKFSMVSPGLNGRDGTVSFESTGFPLHYLRDYAGLVFIDQSNSSRSPATFTQDATFLLRYNRFSSGYYAIESSYAVGNYLRHVNSVVRITSEHGDPNFASEASWSIVQGPVYLESQNYPSQKIAVNQDGEAVMSSNGARWNMVYPSITGTPGTCSIESFENPGFYLRHFDSSIHEDDSRDPKNPDTFASDASFIVRRDIWFDDYVVLECKNKRNYTIRHADSKIQISWYNPDSENIENFKGDASFILREAPLYTDDEVVDDSGPNAGAIVGGIIGVLAVIALIVLAVFAERKYHWTDTVKNKAQSLRRPATEGDTGIENPTYPASGFDTPDAGSGTESSPTTPTTPTGGNDVFADEASGTRSENPVRKLSRRLSDAMTNLKRSTSRSSQEERRIEIPTEFNLNMKDFQPGYSTTDKEEAPNKGSFDNPMYGLTRTVSDDDPSFPSSLDTSHSSNPGAIKRHDSIFDASPTLTATPSSEYEQAMSFFDDQIDKGAKSGGEGEHIDLGEFKTSSTSSSTDEEPVRKKKLSAVGISPISEDDIWDIQ